MSVANASGPSNSFSEVVRHVAANRALWVGAAVLAALVLNLASDPFLTARSLTDPDNATRLLQVNALLEGAGWYDLRLPRLGLPDVLMSHWSRVADAPLAVLLSVERWITGDASADTLTRYIWPVLLMAAMFALVARETERLAGPRAAGILLFLAATSTFATFQFAPGRIDHHNLQILGASGGMIVLYRALLYGHGAVLAGVLLGFGLVIGYEAMALTIAVVGFAVAVAATQPRHLPTMARVLTSLTATLFVGLVINQHPADWLAPACDALGINLVLFAAIGTVATWGAARLAPDASLSTRLALLAAGGAVAAVAYAVPNPACLAGPMAAVDPAIRDIWLIHVEEGASLLSFGAKHPSVSVTYVIVLVGALVLTSRQAVQTRAAADIVAAGAVAMAGVYCTIFIKFFPYAVWLTLPVYALALARLRGTGTVPVRTVQLAGAILLSHGTLLTLSDSGIRAVRAATDGLAPSKTQGRVAIKSKTIHCNARSDIRALNRLPAGRIMNGIDLGPLIAVDTHHRALVGPYHRLDRQILTWHRIFAGAPKDSIRELLEGPYDYVALCAQPEHRIGRPTSLRRFLTKNADHPALEPVDIGETVKPLKVWRIVRPAT
jgi:hypothetical protein